MQQIGSDFLALAAMALKARRALDVPVGRCARCKDRPGFVSDPDPYDPPARRGPLPTPEDLAACTTCGWQPFYVAVEHVDELTGERWTTAEMMIKADHDRALAAEIGWDALIELEKQRFAARRAAAAPPERT